MFKILFTLGDTAKKWVLLLLSIQALALCACSSHEYIGTNNVKNGIVVSIPDQKLAIVKEGKLIKTYPISTSKYGIGDKKGSRHTPLGHHRVAAKIGGDQPEGMVFKSRQPTGEILTPNAPGRDPIVSRILWLQGCEKSNKNAMTRHIYIHGTPEEDKLGAPASYGCIRMGMHDVTELYAEIPKGTPVIIENNSLSSL